MSELKYKVGDKVRIKSLDWYNENKDEDGKVWTSGKGAQIPFDKHMSKWCGKVMTISDVRADHYTMIEDLVGYWTDEMIEGLVEEEVKDMGEVSDGYHTFNELYEYRLLYNASMFNELAKQNLYDVHKSKRHSDGEIPFGDSNWFIVMAELPTGQISNHYEMKDWDLFDIPEKEIANEWDGHTPKDVAERIRRFLTPKPKYPQSYEECCEVLQYDICLKIYPPSNVDVPEYDVLELFDSLESLRKLLICRYAYWKLYGEEMGLGKPWEPDWNSEYFTPAIIYRNGYIQKVSVQYRNAVLSFPTEKMRDAFYENFKKEIEICKEFL